MNGDAPAADSKHTDAGRRARLDLLAAHGLPDAADAVASLAGGALGADDVIDAHAACWTARRIHAGTAERCPPTPDTAPRNARGLRMEIWR
jgi:predicted RNase H-like nuclease